MSHNLIGFYFVLIVLLGLISYAGLEETLKLINYLDLKWRFFLIQIQMKRMKRKLESDLNLPQKKWGKTFNGK